MNRTVIGCVGGLIVGAAIGYGAAGARRASEPPRLLRQKGESLISPLLDYADLDGFVDVNPSRAIKALSARMIATKRATNVSVYFRDLDNGPWFGEDLYAQFSPASLLKVPILIAVLKQAESEPALLGLKLQYAPAGVQETPTIVSRSPLKLGQWYTVEEFLRAMIVHSDNNAAFALLTHVKPQLLDDVYKELHVSSPDALKPDDWLTVKQYSSFFRILYNASYLSKRMSKKALEMLTQVDFRDGIVAGVPPGTVVAHKFGERRLADSDLVQLHDCGIVYYPQQPYVLCVMTRGRDLYKLTGVLKDVSSEVYREVDKQFKAKKP